MDYYVSSMSYLEIYGDCYDYCEKYIKDKHDLDSFIRMVKHIKVIVDERLEVIEGMGLPDIGTAIQLAESIPYEELKSKHSETIIEIFKKELALLVTYWFTFVAKEEEFQDEGL